MRASLHIPIAILLACSGCGDDDAPLPMTDGGAVGADAALTDAARPDAPMGTDAGGASTVTLRDTQDSLAWVAAQDGARGAWTVVADSGGGVYRFDVTSGVYGLALMCDLSSGSNMVVIHATPGEVPNPEAACVRPAPEAVVGVSGNVTGLTGAETATIHISGRQAMATPAMPAWMMSVPMGTRDVFAKRVVASPSPIFDRMIRRNAATLAMGAIFDFDFSRDGFAPETHMVTILGATGSEPTNATVVFRNMSGGSSFPLGSTTTGEFQTLPADELRPGDIHSIVAGSGSMTVFRTVRRLAVVASDFTATLPPAQPLPTIDAAGTAPYLRPRATLVTAGDPDNVTLIYTQRDMTTMRSTAWTLSVTRGWVAATGETALEVADYSAVAGFMPAWGLAAGTSMQWQHFQNWSTLGVADAFSVSQTVADLDGAEYRNTQHLGTITL